MYQSSLNEQSRCAHSLVSSTLLNRNTISQVISVCITCIQSYRLHESSTNGQLSPPAHAAVTSTTKAPRVISFVPHCSEFFWHHCGRRRSFFLPHPWGFHRRHIGGEESLSPSREGGSLCRASLQFVERDL